LSEDFVPDWDFRLPTDVASPKDSSAGAIAACGLLLLADKVASPESPIYRKTGERILQSLYNHYSDWEGSEEGLILHATSHFPQGKYMDNPLIYGDYYFVEGLAYLKGYKELFW
jgi:unsaturated chondroitin disaccharide hydrolase